MIMTECELVGYKTVKDADHKEPIGHYRMTPGKALKADGAGVFQPTTVDEKICKQAKQTFYMSWYRGATVVEFAVGGETYAQPVPGSKLTKEKGQHRNPKKSIAAQVREEREAKTPTKEEIKTFITPEKDSFHAPKIPPPSDPTEAQVHAQAKRDDAARRKAAPPKEPDQKAKTPVEKAPPKPRKHKPPRNFELL